MKKEAKCLGVRVWGGGGGVEDLTISGASRILSGLLGIFLFLAFTSDVPQSRERGEASEKKRPSGMWGPGDVGERVSGRIFGEGETGGRMMSHRAWRYSCLAGVVSTRSGDASVTLRCSKREKASVPVLRRGMKRSGTDPRLFEERAGEEEDEPWLRDSERSWVSRPRGSMVRVAEPR